MPGARPRRRAGVAGQPHAPTCGPGASSVPCPPGWRWACPPGSGPWPGRASSRRSAWAAPPLDLLGWPPDPARPDGRRPSDRPVADITRRRLGPRGDRATRSIPSSAASTPGTRRSMSAAAVFPALLEAAARPRQPHARPAGGDRRRTTDARHRRPTASRPSSYTVRGGLSRLVDAWPARSMHRGVEVRLRTPVERLELRRLDGERAAPGTSATGWTLRTPTGTPWRPTPWSSPPRPRRRPRCSNPSTTPWPACWRAIDYADVTLVTLRIPEDGVGRRPRGNRLPRARRARAVLDHGVHVAHVEVAGPADAPATSCCAPRWAASATTGPATCPTTRSSAARPRRARPHDGAAGAADRGGGDALDRGLPAVRRGPPRAGRRPSSRPSPGCRRLALAGAAYHGVGIPACIASGRQAAARRARGAGRGRDHATGEHDAAPTAGPGRRRRTRWNRRWGRVVVPSLVAGVGLALSLPPWGFWVLAFPAGGLLWWRLGGPAASGPACWRGGPRDSGCSSPDCGGRRRSTPTGASCSWPWSPWPPPWPAPWSPRGPGGAPPRWPVPWCSPRRCARRGRSAAFPWAASPWARPSGPWPAQPGSVGPLPARGPGLARRWRPRPGGDVGGTSARRWPAPAGSTARPGRRGAAQAPSPGVPRWWSSSASARGGRLAPDGGPAIHTLRIGGGPGRRRARPAQVRGRPRHRHRRAIRRHQRDRRRTTVAGPDARGVARGRGVPRHPHRRDRGREATRRAGRPAPRHAAGGGHRDGVDPAASATRSSPSPRRASWWRASRRCTACPSASTSRTGDSSSTSPISRASPSTPSPGTATASCTPRPARSGRSCRTRSSTPTRGWITTRAGARTPRRPHQHLVVPHEPGPDPGDRRGPAPGHLRRSRRRPGRTDRLQRRDRPPGPGPGSLRARRCAPSSSETWPSAPAAPSTSGVGDLPVLVLSGVARAGGMARARSARAPIPSTPSGPDESDVPFKERRALRTRP